MRYACLLALVATLSSAALAPARAATDPKLLQPNPVDVHQGRNLHLACAGEGSPTIVFEQGASGAITDWRKVLPQASALTRACVYDRAGFGLSDPAKETVTGISVTDDLRRLLLAAKIAGPVVLVGQDIGGFYATVYADRFPQAVAGLVLVEPSFGGQVAPANARQRNREQKARGQAESQLQACAAMARDGKLTASEPQGCFTLAPDLAPAEAAYVTAMSTRAAPYDAALDQSKNFFPRGEAADSIDWRQARIARSTWGSKPLVVLSAANAPRDKAQNDAAYRAFSAHWKDGHRQLAARSTKGEWQEVPASGHDIALDQPAAVVAAIQKVVTAARAAHPVAEKAASGAKAKGKARPKAKAKATGKPKLR